MTSVARKKSRVDRRVLPSVRRDKRNSVRSNRGRVAYTHYTNYRVDVKFDKRALISRAARVRWTKEAGGTWYRALSLLVDDEGIAKWAAAATRQRRRTWTDLVPSATRTQRAYHLYNKLLIGADVLGRAVRVVVLVLRVPYLARVRSLEGDSWTHKSQSCTRDTGSIVARSAIAERARSRRAHTRQWGSRGSQWPNAQPASRPSASPSLANGRRYVSIGARREITGGRWSRHRGRSYLPYRYSSAMAIGLDINGFSSAWCARGTCACRTRWWRSFEWRRVCVCATVTVLLREGKVAARAGRRTSA